MYIYNGLASAGGEGVVAVAVGVVVVAGVVAVGVVGVAILEGVESGISLALLTAVVDGAVAVLLLLLPLLFSLIH